MSSYQLSPYALADLEGVLFGVAEHVGSKQAERIQGELLAAFERIAVTPGLGHRRPDLTTRGFFFHAVTPYLIVYGREIDPLPILAVLHASRDVRRLLRVRFGSETRGRVPSREPHR